MADKAKPDFMADKLFDVEHALILYALSYLTIPAEALYDKDRLKDYEALVADCHIYIVGFVPQIDLKDMKLEGTDLRMSFEILAKRYDLVWETDEGFELVEIDGSWHLTKEGLFADPPGQEACCLRLHEKYGIGTFLVKYIGQAYGKDGSRNALDRLMKHEKLQEIAIKGVPAGYKLQVLMLAIAPANKILTVFNPWAKDDTQGDARINQGLDKLFGTTEKERVCLYEAALIRYFMPDYNFEFKESFPSTNLKILQDCYSKDFSAVSAEILFDEMPFTLYSETAKKTDHHLAFFDLHEDTDRKVFFATA